MTRRWLVRALDGLAWQLGKLGDRLLGGPPELDPERLRVLAATEDWPDVGGSR